MQRLGWKIGKIKEGKNGSRAGHSTGVAPGFSGATPSSQIQPARNDGQHHSQLGFCRKKRKIRVRKANLHKIRAEDALGITGSSVVAFFAPSCPSLRFLARSAAPRGSVG